MLDVAGCVIVENKQILLLHRINPSRYELPGGKIEKGETAEEAVKREAQEEILCKVQIIKKLNDVEFEEDGQIIHYTRFLAKIKNNQQPSIGEPQKFDEVCFVQFEELDTMHLSPNMENLYKQITKGKILQNVHNIGVSKEKKV